MSVPARIPDPIGSPPAGPSDSSDSPSDLPASSPQSDSDSDAQGTGDRPAADPLTPEDAGSDIAPDGVVDETGAGVSHAPPDAARNGGVPARRPTTTRPEARP
ncbi:MatE family transporter [Achromobacter xylosoxidans]|uniref:MatE family transporter n=1 Tax=Alcaligenes xylosoxydans xylosoxydans TaxID=85698 RepID=UPI0038FBFD03